LSVFIRKKKNRSGTTSVVIVDKSFGKYREIKTIGISSDEQEIDSLLKEGEKWINNHTIGEDIFDQYERNEEETQYTLDLLNNIEKIKLNGVQLIINQVYDSIGFNEIKDKELRYLVIARLTQPLSKSATVEYLKSYFDEDTSLNKIYRYMDKLYNTQQEQIQEISVNHTKGLFGGKIGLLFYDVTTLYFETEKTDNLREPGFSKDGKHSQSQLVLGLLVSKDGYPLSYSLFNGSQYEGYTMLPVIEDFITKFKLEEFVVVADSGLMSAKNIKLLEEGGYKYIIGARIKSSRKTTKNWILSLEKEEGKFYEKRENELRLIVSYSSKRAKKDKYNREKGVKRLEKSYKGGKLTKENINKRGYNKFLEISKDVGVRISEEKITEDEKWDGLKGYITNTELMPEEVYKQYYGLWVVERAFRITKGTLETRPIFHFTERRIEAHVSICFVAYKVYKEMERVLKLKGMIQSVDTIIKTAKTITTLEIKLKKSNTTINKTMFLTEEQKAISPLFKPKFWKT
jgi:transposase